MKIGIIGISSLTLEIASRCSLKGYEVKIYNPKGNSLIRDVAQKMGSHVSLCSLEQAADTDIVLLFIPKDDLQRIVQMLPDMSGKLIIHTSSLIFDPRSLVQSLAEINLLQRNWTILLFMRIKKGILIIGTFCFFFCIKIIHNLICNSPTNKVKESASFHCQF